MREKKYANVLDTDFEENVIVNNDLDDDVETKLSMTRELKFKELQESIDTSEADRPELVEEKIEEVFIDDLKEEKNILEDTDLLFDEKVSKKKKKKDVINDDIYLTASFKPFKKRIRLKKIFKVLFSLILFAALGISLTYFLIIPIYNKLQSSKPKAIFDASITYVGEQFGKIIDLTYMDMDVFDLEAIFNFESNIEELDVLTKDDFGIKVGVDPDKEVLETMYFVENNNEKHGYSIINNNNELYYKFSNSENYIKRKNNSEVVDFDSIKEMYTSKVSLDEYKYYIDANVKILKEVITDDLLTFEKDEIEIDGKSFNVVKNSLVFNKNTMEEFEKKYNEKVLKEDKLLRIEALINGISVSEVEESYNNINEYDDDFSLVINIYTIKGNKIVGFDVEEDGFRNIFYYNYNGKFEAHFNLGDDTCTKEDCLLENKFVIDLVGTKKDNYTEVQIMYNDEKVGTLDVRTFNYEFIDFDYDLIIGDIVLEGTVKVDINKEQEEFNFKFSFEFNNQYVDMEMKVKFYINSNIGYVDSEHIINYTDKVFNAEYSNLEEKLKEIDSLELFELFISVLDDSSGSSEDVLKDVIDGFKM